MKKIGLELLRTRLLSDKVDVLKFQQEKGFELPPLYKAFVETFYVGKDLIIGEQFLNPKIGFPVDLMAMKYYPNEEVVLFYNFFELEETSIVHQMLFFDDEEIKKKQLLSIGECGMNWMLMVGLNNEDEDKIFLERTDMNPRFIFLAENIFNFMRGLVQEEDESGNIGNYNFSQLYKNWNEDFWRVREDKTSD